MTATAQTEFETRSRGGRDRMPLHVAVFALLALAGAALLVWLALRPKLSDETRRRMLTDLAAWDAAMPEQRLLAARWVAARESAFALSRLDRFTCGGQSHEVAVFAHAATGLEFSLVPGGTFEMGSPEGFGREAREVLHAVTLTRPFLIARTECTQAAYERAMGTNPSAFKGASRPVENVSWDQAAEFCRRIGFSLPTEAQWERACRAGTTTRFCAGDKDADLERCAWVMSNAESTTHDVGTKEANALGLFDVHGNVGEWCSDWYEYSPAVSVTDPIGALSGIARVERGGSWLTSAQVARSAWRGWAEPAYRDYFFGFRPAKVVPPE